MPEAIKPAYTQSLGGQQMTGVAASAALTNIPTLATWAIIKPRVQGIYLRLDGTAASATGMLIEAGVPVEVTSKLSDVRILEAAGGAVVDIWWFG